MYVHAVISINPLNVLFFSEFNCKAVSEKLRKLVNTLSKLNYNAMKTSLFAKNVIIDQEMKMIDVKIGEEQMTHLIIHIIIPSLIVNNTEKYKGFLEAMEESDDTDLKGMAKKLGKIDHNFNGIATGSHNINCVAIYNIQSQLAS